MPLQFSLVLEELHISDYASVRKFLEQESDARFVFSPFPILNRTVFALLDHFGKFSISQVLSQLKMTPEVALLRTLHLLSGTKIDVAFEKPGLKRLFNKLSREKKKFQKARRTPRKNYVSLRNFLVAPFVLNLEFSFGQIEVFQSKKRNRVSLLDMALQMDPKERKAELEELNSFYYVDTEAKERDQEIDPIEYARAASDSDLEKLLNVLLTEKQETFLSFCERHILELKPLLLTLLRGTKNEKGMIKVDLKTACSLFYTCQLSTRKYTLLQKYLPEARFPSYDQVRDHALEYIPEIEGFTSKRSGRQGARISFIDSIQKQLAFENIREFYDKHRILPIKLGGDGATDKKTRNPLFKTITLFTYCIVGGSETEILVLQNYTNLGCYFRG